MSSTAVIYNRISEDRSGEAAGVARQREDCERRASERGWTVVATEIDNDISAAGRKTRPGFENVLDLVEADKVDVVLAWSLDRLTRNRRDQLRLFEAAKDHNVTLSLINGTDLDFSTAAGRFVADSLGSVARLEIELKSDRQRRAVEQAVQQGRRVGGRRPFGYETDGMTVRDDEAEAIRDGYRDLLAGVPSAAIARDWNRRGFSTGQGSPWAAYSVRNVLKNARNAGLRSHNRDVKGKAAWPPLVDEETWAAATAIYSDPTRRTGGNGRPRLLSGVARCTCGATAHAGGGNRPGVPAYRCSGSMGHFARKAEPVEDYVSALVVARLSRPDAQALLRPSAAGSNLGVLQTELNSVTARLDGLALDYADGILTREQVKTATARLQQRRMQIEGLLTDSSRRRTLGPLVESDSVLQAWESLDIERRREIVDLLMEVELRPVGRGKRDFDPATIGITWRS